MSATNEKIETTSQTVENLEGRSSSGTSIPRIVLKFIQAITGAEQNEIMVAISTIVVMDVDRTESKVKDPIARIIRKEG